MNQILATHNNENNKRKAPIDTKKIIVFFCISIIVFGLAIISVASYKLYDSKKQAKKIKDIGNPKATIEQMEDEKSIKITAEYANGIKTIKYTWNEQDSHEVQSNGSTKIERLIDMVETVGENKLEVEVIGVDNRSTTTTAIFTVEAENPETKEKPKLGWSIQDEKIIVFATSKIGLKNVKYQWDNEEPTIIEPSETEKNQLKTEIEIRRGQYRLTVTAEDINGETDKKSDIFKGVKKPEITATKYGDVVEIIVSHDMGLKKIEFIVNDKIYVYDENYAGYSALNTSLKYSAKLVEGENVIQVTAESLELNSADGISGTTAIYKGKCIYEKNTNE